MEPLDFGKFIVQLIRLFCERLTFFTICDKGQAVIKKRLGYPIKWRSKPGLYWKIPLIDVFDKVDMRKKYTAFLSRQYSPVMRELIRAIQEAEMTLYNRRDYEHNIHTLIGKAPPRRLHKVVIYLHPSLLFWACALGVHWYMGGALFAVISQTQSML